MNKHMYLGEFRKRKGKEGISCDLYQKSLLSYSDGNHVELTPEPCKQSKL